LGQKEKARPSRNFGESKCGKDGGFNPERPNPGIGGKTEKLSPYLSSWDKSAFTFDPGKPHHPLLTKTWTQYTQFALGTIERLSVAL